MNQRVMLRVHRARAFPGAVRAEKRSLRWHPRWAVIERRVAWPLVHGCTAGVDRRPGVAAHTHRLVVYYDGGVLEVWMRGPWGAVALAELRDAIQTAAHLDDQ